MREKRDRVVPNLARTTSADNCHGPWLLEQRPEGRLPVAIAGAGKAVATIEAVDQLPLGRSPQTHAKLQTAIEKLLDEVAQRTSSEKLDK
ncbi:conserved hypothetical protein [Trichinella spiralis]|uniref:hypothetical protein n=1 Tax=Trichinella spiralis TaxID=6334 RepID=UPI0001EFDB51|nr:conserved hypothetical protein [Trichinella spiralis]